MPRADGVLPARVDERAVHAAAACVRQDGAAHQRHAVLHVDRAAEADRPPVRVGGEVVHRAVRVEAPTFRVGAPDALLRAQPPHLPVDLERRELLVERLDPADVHVRRCRRRRVAAHPAQQPLLVVVDEPEGGEALDGVRGRGAPADPPFEAARAAPPCSSRAHAAASSTSPRRTR